VGVLDEDRYIQVVDRKKDMIKSGGENISTREVEEVIYLDSRVQEAAVIGVSHPKWVEAVVAVVVPKSGQTIQEQEIVDLCRRELAPFKVPKTVLFREELPKTPSGKILKRDMRKSYGELFTK
jgi:fatty-acyl-CoA synthase